jgi:hypothetical protein
MEEFFAGLDAMTNALETETPGCLVPKSKLAAFDETKDSKKRPESRQATATTWAPAKVTSEQEDTRAPYIGVAPATTRRESGQDAVAACPVALASSPYPIPLQRLKSIPSTSQEDSQKSASQ